MTTYKKICIIGSNGYLGSSLSTQFPDSVKISKTIQYTKEFLQQFSVIIYCAGISSRTATKEQASANITDIKNLADHLENQLLIYMSTSAIYEGLTDAREDSIIEISNLEEYSKSMLERENLIFNYKTFTSIGLRLGNVTGFPPIGSTKTRRKNVYLSLLLSALTIGVINITYPESKRAFLSLDDFNRVIKCILSNRNITGHHIYNISNYNLTIEAVAQSIAQITGCSITYDLSSNYTWNRGFSVNPSKFKIDFAFEYLDHPSSVLQKLFDRKEELLQYFITG